MLKWSAIFFLIALVAALLGFTSIAGAAMGVAKFLFILFLIPAVALLIAGLFFVAKT